jgi:hypothetical protein
MYSGKIAVPPGGGGIQNKYKLRHWIPQSWDTHKLCTETFTQLVDNHYKTNTILV